MNIAIVKNKYLNALFLLMLVSATVHMLILFGFAIAKQDIYILNYFNILDLDIIFPSILFNSLVGNISAGLLVLVIYFLILTINKTHENQ